MKISSVDFFRKLRIRSHLPKKSLTENLIFSAVSTADMIWWGFISGLTKVYMQIVYQKPHIWAIHVLVLMGLCNINWK